MLSLLVKALLAPVRVTIRFFTGEPIFGYRHGKTDATWKKPATRYVPLEERRPRHWWS